MKLRIRLLKLTALKTSYSTLTLLLRLIINSLNVIKRKVIKDKD
ncbi:hypothetical protein GQ607_016935 [Colletotrichum asianum]|uniref:Uncharacterized protein n=1 Tax=Colletotrichum asianum TaxID=702518 RepID=A0A8H3VX88_9PEZI|nr:hypothetical protein GQ607_016935 [Colletotrichum asianum]